MSAASVVMVREGSGCSASANGEPQFVVAAVKVAVEVAVEVTVEVVAVGGLGLAAGGLVVRGLLGEDSGAAAQAASRLQLFPRTRGPQEQQRGR